MRDSPTWNFRTELLKLFEAARALDPVTFEPLASSACSAASPSDPGREGTVLVSHAQGALSAEAMAELQRRCDLLRSFWTVIHQTPVAIWATDGAGIVHMAEGQGLANLGLTSAAVEGRRFADVLPDDSPLVVTARRTLAGAVVDTTLEIGARVFDSHSAPTRDEQGRISGAAGIMFDVTNHSDAIREALAARASLREQVAARDRELAEHGRLMQSVLDAIGDGVAVVDPHGELHFNPAGAALLSISAVEHDVDRWTTAYGLYLPDCSTPYPTEDLPLVRAMRGESVAQAPMFAKSPQMQDGVWLSVTANPVQDPERGMLGAVAVFRDVTRTKQYEDALAAERQSLRDMLQAHERDRKLTAYELHDGLVQQITGAAMHLEAIRNQLPPDQQPRLTQPIAWLRDAIDEARQLINGLRPPVIDELGVEAAVEYLLSAPRMGAAVQFDYEHNLSGERFDPLLEATVFRIVQEAVTNVRRHSGADRARVSLKLLEGKLRVVVEDSGKGFNVRDVSRQRFGLRGIRERARLFGGTAEIDSTPGQGTRVTVQLPLSRAWVETSTEEGRS